MYEDHAGAGDVTAAQIWRAVAARRADEIAVRTPDESVTFCGALTVADRRAGLIAAAVPERSRPVAIDVESDVDSVLSVLAVLCSGHPVIVLDPFLPEARRERILALSGAHLLTADDLRAPLLQNDTAPPNDTASPNNTGHPEHTGHPEDTDHPDSTGIELPVDIGPDDPATLIFTSGSTGEPKGVVHAQRFWVNQATDGRVFLGLGPDDSAATLLPLSFGAGFDCVMMTLLNGAGLLLWDVRRRGVDGLRDWLDEQQATTVHCTPSLLRSWLPDARADTSADQADPGAMRAVDSVRLLTTCGEPVHSGDVDRVRAHLMPGGVFCSWSGSSETGNLAFNRLPANRAHPPGVIAVGTPASDKHVRIVGEDGADLPAGSAGEVVIESAHIALGYHGAPELTAARFTDLGAGRRRYRTGDLGRLDDEGRLHLLGRKDDAVKIRGYLVEPIEVEVAIRALPWTADAVVTADRSAHTLVAHVAVDPDLWSPSPAEIRTEMSKTVPPWMIPRDVVVLAELPRNERGKVDRAALPPPPERVPEPARGLTEADLANLWQEILALDVVGRNEDFVALGGDSLAAATMLRRVADRWLVEIATADFAAEPTIAALGALLDAASETRARTEGVGSITRLRSGTGRPLFIAAGAGSPAAGLLPLVRELAGDYPVYGLQAHGLERRGRADRSIRAAARRAVRDILAVEPAGPYRLCGYSYGGFVMLEAATILAGRGAECESVVLLDPIFEPELLARVTGGAVDPAATAPEREALPDRTGTGEADREPPGPRERVSILWNRALMSALVATAGLVRLPTAVQWTVFWDLGRQQIKRHRPAVYPGSAVVVMADANSGDAATWDRLVAGGPIVVRVSGDHHSMLRPPLVRETAKVLAEAVATGHEGARGEDTQGEDSV